MSLFPTSTIKSGFLMIAVYCGLCYGQLMAQSALTPFADVCVNTAPFALSGGTPVGGSYFGAGVTGVTGSHMFDPALAGVGVHPIGYHGLGTTDSAYQNIRVDGLPSVNFAAPGPYCGNQDSVALTGGTPAPGTYFGPGVSSSSGNFDRGIAPNNYMLSYTHTDPTTGCSDTADATVTVHAVTPADFTGLASSYCPEAPSPVTLTPVFPLAGGVFGPASLFTTQPNFDIPAVPGNYEVTFSYTDGTTGCSDTLTRPVDVLTPPSVNFQFNGTQSAVCDKDAPFVLSDASATPPGGVFTGTTGIIGTNIFNPADPGVMIGLNKIKYTVTDGNGCSNTDSSRFINVKASPTVSFDLPFDTICSNNPAFLIPNGMINGVSSPSGTYTGAGVTPPPYQFNPGSIAPPYGDVTITYTGTDNGCSRTTTRTIYVSPKPDASFTNTVQACGNDSAFALTAGLPLGGKYYGIGVAPDSATFDPALTPGFGTYQLFYKYTDNLGCSDTINQPMILDTFLTLNPTTIPNPAKMCIGDSVEITAASTPSSPTNKISFQWSSGIPGILSAITGDNTVAKPLQNTTVTLTGFYDNKCPSTRTIDIEVVPEATATIEGDLEICFGDSTTLTASGANSYEWQQTGETTPTSTYTPIWDTIVSVIAFSDVDGNGKQCSDASTEVLIVVNPLPIISAGIDTNAFLGDEVPLKGRGGVLYTWSGNDGQGFSCTDCEDVLVTAVPSAFNAKTITYFVDGTDANGCTNRDSIVVTLDEKIIVFVPSAFSPNDDGANDVLFVRGKSVKSIDFKVLNRRGEQVFQSTDMEVGWDGTYKGSPLNKDVFVYYLTVQPYFKPAFKQTGSITLVR